MTPSEWARDRLRNLGLNAGLWKQLKECDPATALPLMDELERGGRDVIRQVNSAYRRVSLAPALAHGTATGTASSPDAAQT